MRHRSSLWLWCLPLALLGGCLLPEFDNVPAPTPAEGGSEGGGTGPTPVAGAGGEGATANGGGGGGNEPKPVAPSPVDDTYVVEQGKAFTLTAARGVLANDGGATLRVTGFEPVDAGRPATYDAELTLEQDGSLVFTPQGDFFGRYDVDYTVTAEDEQTATARITFVVQPVAASLSAVEDGVGGVVLSGRSGDELGASVVGVGDVDADGFDDFVIGAPGAQGGAGAVYVVFGRRDFGGFSLEAADEGARFSVLSGGSGERVGSYLAAAGRYDADSVPDILIGSPLGGQQFAEDGALYLVFGGTNLRTSAALSATTGLIIEGQAFLNQRVGTLVAGAGDFDGNQRGDVLTGFNELGDAVRGIGLLLEAPTEDTSIDQVAYDTVTETTNLLPLSVCFAGDVTGDGKDDILASSRASIALLPGNEAGDLPSDLQTVSPDGSMFGFRLERPPGSNLAAPVAPAGDLNGDGKADLVYCDGPSNSAVCSILFGDISVGRTLADADWSVTGFEATASLPLVAPGSDLNQDEFSDLLVADETAAYVVFGRDAGFGAVNVSSLGDDGFSLAAPDGGKIGAVASIGDVNGDGYNDVAIADPSAAGGVGRVYVVFGGPFSAEQR